MPTPNILICGKTGAGKTSLVQAMTRNLHIVPDAAIGHAQPTTKGFEIYQTPEVNYIDAEGMEPGMTNDYYIGFLYSEIWTRLEAQKADNIVHCVWYCIDGSCGRVQETDAMLIDRLNQLTDNVIVLITKNDQMRTKQREALVAAVRQIVQQDQIHLICSNKENPSGLDTLITATRQKTAVALRDAQKNIARFHAICEMFKKKKEEEEAQRKNNELTIQNQNSLLDQRLAKGDQQANELIIWGVCRSVLLAVVPIPMVDVIPLMINEAYMVYRMGRAYGFHNTASQVVAFASLFFGSLIGKSIASWIPGLKMVIAGVVTYGIGISAKTFFRAAIEQERKNR